MFEILLIGLFFVGTLVAASAAYMRRKKLIAETDFEAPRRRGKEGMDELIARHYPQVKTWLNDRPIDAFTSVRLPATFSDHAKNLAKDIAKAAAWGAVGVKAHYQRVETDKFGILSGDQFIVLGTDVDGSLKDMWEFNMAQMEHVQFNRLSTPLRPDTGGLPNDPTKRYNMQFTLQGNQIALEILDRVTEVKPSIVNLFGNKEYFELVAKRKASGERFLDLFAQRQPQLQSELSQARSAA